jgi:hypothetical protein
MTDSPAERPGPLSWRATFATTLGGVFVAVVLLVGGYYESGVGMTLWTIALFTVLGTLVVSLFLADGLRRDRRGAPWVRTAAWLTVAAAVALVVVPLVLLLVLMTSDFPSDRRSSQ